MPRGNENDIPTTPAPPVSNRSSDRDDGKAPSDLTRRFITANVEFVRFPRKHDRVGLEEPTFMITQCFDQEKNEEVSVKGTMLVDSGDVIRAEGEFKYDLKFGWAFNATRIDISSPVDRQAVELWLSDNSLELSQAHVGRIATKWGEDAPEILSENPHAICDLGIDFSIADHIGASIGVDPLAEGRMIAASQLAFSESEGEGDCALESKDAIQIASEIAGVSGINGVEEILEKALKSLYEDGDIVEDEIDGKKVLYRRKTWEVECSTASMIKSMLARDPDSRSVPKVRSRGRFRLTREQRSAVDLACTEPFGVVTGGPGVGKTSVLLATCEALDKMGQSYALAAPTGKAAKRMKESTGKDAETLHRLLGWKYVIGEESEPEPLGCDVLIVDESSMIDLNLMEKLLGRAHKSTRLILVGDADQLPPVGAGSVFRDVIASGEVPTARLTKTFRQGAGSLTLTNAQRIRDGKEPFWTTEQAESAIEGDVRQDFKFIECDDPKEAATIARSMATKEDTMILSPSRSGKAGVHALNHSIQEERNPRGEIVCETEDYELRVGDSILVTRNDYKLDIVNGDMGKIIGANQDGSLIDLLIEGRVVNMGLPQAERVVELGYALTIHKSQGSQAESVICPIGTDAANRMLSRNLLYTAWTRGKKECVVIGPKSAVRSSLNVDGTHRKTGLAQRIAAS